MKAENEPQTENTQPAWHTHKPQEAIETLASNTENGLYSEEVSTRLEQYGPNKLPEAKPDTLFKIFFRQFQSPLIYLLLAAAVVVLLLEEWMDGGIIIFVLLFNAVAGTIQAGRAQNTLLALKKFTKTQATVLRDGKEIVISDEEVVPGDILLLQEGEKVAADARLIEAHNLRAGEAALTGEADPVGKDPEATVAAEAATHDQANMVFKGTNVIAGTAKAVVVMTGVNTVIGKISEQMTTIERSVPLQEDIKYLSNIIIGVVLTMSVIIFSLAFFLGGIEGTEAFMIAVAVVVSAIPEGLPIVMTLLLATGVWRMSKRNVLVKHLQAVEALGEAEVIAVDKTGTITKNELTVQRVLTSAHTYEVQGSGYDTGGEIRLGEEAVNPDEHPDLLLAARIGAFCSNARLSFDEEAQKWSVSGDPTEAAMMVYAQKAGLSRADLLKTYPQIDEIPFDADLKFHAVTHDVDGQSFLAVAGAPEILLERCTNIVENGEERPLTEEDRQNYTKAFKDMSAEALRLIALAKKDNVEELKPEAVTELTFVGFFAMKDAMRDEVFDAMEAAQSAGIRVVMITGDHKITAQAIASDAGIYHEGDNVLTDDDIESMSDHELAEQLGNTTVFARITPEHKLRIVSAYRLRDEIVAMTGDGVNDALSLVKADLGVGMGRSGTEVAKEASDLILLDDNFGSIVSAVEEGRSIYKNMKKVLLYLFSTSVGELMTIVAAISLGYPLPILAAQLLWLNLVTDGFLDAALAMERKEKGLLKEKFVRPKKWIVDGWMAQRLLLMSSAMAVTALLLFIAYVDVDYTKATTMVLTSMAVFQWYKVYICRSERTSIFKLNPFSNMFLNIAIPVVIGLHMLVLYTPLGQTIFSVTPLSLSEWGIILVTALSTIVVDELRKLIYWKFEAKKQQST